jgi:hypothetical protein
MTVADSASLLGSMVAGGTVALVCVWLIDRWRRRG